MISVMITGCRREQDTIESFNHEFEVVHPALMRAARCERYIRRYTQSKPVRELRGLRSWLRLDERIDSQVSIVVPDGQALAQCFNDREYIERVMPHRFTDPAAMTFEIAEQITLKTGVAPGPLSVKALYYLAPRPGITASEFRTFVDDTYSRVVIAPRQSVVASHRRAYPVSMQPREPQDSPFAHAPPSRYGAIDELWFDDMNALRHFHDDRTEAIRNDIGTTADLEKSFMFVATERVVITDNIWL